MTTTTIRNGVNTEALFGAVDAVKSMPAAAKFQFRATTEWISGTHSQTTVYDFFGLGEEQTHTEARTYDADHPKQLVATDLGSTPAEFLLVALASCITAGIGNISAARGVELRKVTSTIRGDIDLVGLLGLDDTVRNGYQSIEMEVDIEGNASKEVLSDIVKRSMARSAVYDLLTNGTKVAVTVKR